MTNTALNASIGDDTDKPNKHAITATAIHELMQTRWSPRAFDAARAVETDKLDALCEAARWAPSCFNDQPWRLLVCDRFQNEAAWGNALDLLADKNRLWAQQAPLLILACASERFSHNGNSNRWAQYDTGAAIMSLCLQATALGLHVHQMGGFDSDAARERFALPDEVTPMAMIAVGYMGESEKLHDMFRQAEQAPRERRAMEQIRFEGKWGESS